MAEDAQTLANLAPELFDASDSFIRQNSNFESSIVQQRVIDSIGAASDAMLAFAIPLQNAILTMDGALRWALFWWSAVEHQDTGGLPLDGFTLNGAMATISQVYDIAYQEQVLQHFEGESDDDEGDDSEEYEDENETAGEYVEAAGDGVDATDVMDAANATEDPFDALELGDVDGAEDTVGAAAAEPLSEVL